MKPMKKVFKALAILTMTLTTATAVGQVKIGHCNTDSLIVLMPEYTTAMTKMDSTQKHYEQELKDMQTELETLSASLQANSATMSALRKQREQEDLQMKYQRMQQFAQDAQQILVTAEQELLNPVIEKLQDAINQVGESKGLDYVLDSSRRNGVIIYKKDSRDITNDVKAKLNLI